MLQRKGEVKKEKKGALKTRSYTLLTVLSSKRRQKKLLKVFSKSLIPPVCNVTPREHKNEMSKHFFFFFNALTTQYKRLLPNWISFNMLGGFWSVFLVIE